MPSIRKDIVTTASPAQVWAAIADIGALHTRLVPGFVIATRLEPGARVVTFANGMTVREPIVSLDENAMRLVWSVEGGQTTHFNGAVQVIPEPDGSARVVWISDFLPGAASNLVEAAMTAGAAAMKCALDEFQPGGAAQPGG